MTSSGAGFCAFFWLLICSLLSVSTGAPVFTNNPKNAGVGSQEQSVRWLTYIDISETNPYTCTIQSQVDNSNNAVNLFNIVEETRDEVFFLETAVSAVGDFPLGEVYTITVQCEGPPGSTSTGQVITTVKNNQLLRFDANLLNSVDLSAPAYSTSGITIDQISHATELLGEAINYNLTIREEQCKDAFSINSNTGEVTTVGSLYAKIDFASTQTCSLTIWANTNSITIKRDVAVNLNDQNHLCTMNNVPTDANGNHIVTTQPLEDLAVGDTIFQMGYEDLDSGQVHSFRMSCLPAVTDGRFTIDSAGRIKVLSALNHEYQPTSTCTVYCNDSIAEAGPFQVVIGIQDVNEECSFRLPGYSGSGYEGNAGSIVFTPDFVLDDEDDSDSHEFSFVAGTHSNAFSIDKDTGEIRNTAQIDREQQTNSEISLVVRAIDSGVNYNTKRTCTTTVIVDILDINDNTPDFSSSVSTITVTQDTAVGSLYDLAPVDPDLGDFGTVTCVEQSAAGDTSKTSLDSNCKVRVTESFAGMNAGHVVTYNLVGQDGGTPPNQGYHTVSVVYSPTVTTTIATTTTTQATFFDGAGIALTVLLSLLGLALLGLLGYCLFRYCCGGGTCNCMGGGRNSTECCARRRPPPRKITPEPRTPPRRTIEKRPVMVRQEPRLVQQPIVRTVMQPTMRPFMQPMSGPPPYATLPSYGFRGPPPLYR